MRRKIIVLISLMFLFGMVSVYSAETNNPIDILLNGFKINSMEMSSEKEEVIDIITEVSKKAGFLTDYHEIKGTFEINDPAVNMILAMNATQNGNQIDLDGIFHKVVQGTTLSFDAFAVFDNAPINKTVTLKFIIEDPDGTVIAEGEPRSWAPTQDGKSFEFGAPFKSVHFASVGEYKVKLLMKTPSIGEYRKVGQASIFVSGETKELVPFFQ